MAPLTPARDGPRRGLGRVRLALLLCALAAVAGWTVRAELRLRQRRAWEQSLSVAVVLLTPDGGGDGAAWGAGLDRLAARLEAERARWQGPGPIPFRLELVGPVPWQGSFPPPPSSNGLAQRARHGLEVSRLLRELDRASGIRPRDYDLRVYVLDDGAGPADAESFAEGEAELGGDVALVHGSARGDLDLPLKAIGHELLHTVGATDKYDANGHAVEPQGLAEPDRAPAYPQRFAEWMAGEVPLSPGRGRLPASLDEVRVGPVTARGMGWMGGPSRPRIE